MEIKACPKCGSRKIYQGRMGDGVLTGYTSRDVCRNCGYQGMPIIFDSELDYKNFLKSKDFDDKNLNNLVEKNSKLIIKKKQRRPIGIDILVIFMVLEAVIAIYLYYTLFESNIPLLLWIYYITIFVISAIILPVGLLKAKGWAWTIGAILFALSILAFTQGNW